MGDRGHQFCALVTGLLNRPGTLPEPCRDGVEGAVDGVARTLLWMWDEPADILDNPYADWGLREDDMPPPANRPGTFNRLVGAERHGVEDLPPGAVAHSGHRLRPASGHVPDPHNGAVEEPRPETAGPRA
jgi:hypothetical protein